LVNMVQIDINVGPRLSLEEVEKLLGEFPSWLSTKLPVNLMNEIAPVLTAESKEICPKKTHQLADSIHGVVTTTGIAIVANAYDKHLTNYAIFIEEGTSNIVAYNYILTPIINHWGEINECIERTIREFWREVEGAV